MSTTVMPSEYDLACPACGRDVAAAREWRGEIVECPHCLHAFAIPRSHASPADGRRSPNKPSPSRRFNFICKRCNSVLEARSDQSGTAGACPTCAARFIIPSMDPRTGRATGPADPGDDGQDPTLLHAYAAAGAQAPRIERSERGVLTIRCPRCDRRAAIDANDCSGCGLPFTLEGMKAPGPADRLWQWAALPMYAALAVACLWLPAAAAMLALAFGLFHVLGARQQC